MELSMQENPRFEVRRFRRQPPLGTHEPNKPKLCYNDEPVSQHEGFTNQLELGLILPYVNHLKSEIVKERREELRARQEGIDSIYRNEQDIVIPQIFKLPTGVIFEQPIFQKWVEDSKKPK